MKYHISGPSILKGTITLPTSKSISNRALILKALSNEKCILTGISECDDTHVMIQALNSLPNSVVDIGAAGTSMRFLTAYLSRVPGVHTLTGSDRMKNRPIAVLVDALRLMGAQIEYLERTGFPPLRIQGKALQGGEISLQGDVSSQFISALLMIAPTTRQGITLHLRGEVISKPYIAMTLGLLERFGVEASWIGNTIRILPQNYRATSLQIEADWSAASYWYQLLALAPEGEIKLIGVNNPSVQGDAKVAELFADLGIRTTYTNDGALLSKQETKAKKMFYNFVNEPDLAQTMVVTCCLLGIPFLFTGLQSLKIKETDRITALKNEMQKLGFVLTESKNSILEWRGERCQPEESPIIKTYEDHRMAMAFTGVAFTTAGVSIAHPEVVSKSYPLFWQHLQKVGFTITSNSL